VIYRRFFSIFSGPVWAAILVLFLSSSLRAEVRSVVVSSSISLGSFNGRAYDQYTATLQGTVGEGTLQHSYSVPLVLAYPSAPQDANGFALLDVPNSAIFEVYPSPQYILPFARLSLGQDFIFGRGYVYAAVQWNKVVTDRLYGGGIISSTDGYQILIDLANWLRYPTLLTGPAEVKLNPAPAVIAVGYSQSGALLRHFYLSGRNAQLSFDGALIVSAGAVGLRLEENLPREYLTVNADGSGMALPEDGKVIEVNTETDVTYLSSWLNRTDTTSSRHYEIAGVAHLPPAILNLSSFGAKRQNPVDFSPAMRAQLENLHDWIADDTLPPPSLTMAGGAQLQYDSDGNAKGGVRLPHLYTRLPSGLAGAPLGIYGGFDPTVTWPAYLGGTFQPFSPAKLRQLYPSQSAYVSAVTRAAEAAVAARFLLEEDKEQYVSVAAAFQITCPQILNPGFENGASNPSPWIVTAGVTNNSASKPAHSGNWKAWLDGYGVRHLDTLAQQVLIPATANQATLSFWLHIDTAETTTRFAYDTLTVQIRNASGSSVLATLATYSNLDANPGYRQVSFDLLPFKGQSIQIYLIGAEDYSLQTSFIVDDFALTLTDGSGSVPGACH